MQKTYKDFRRIYFKDKEVIKRCNCNSLRCNSEAL